MLRSLIRLLTDYERDPELVRQAETLKAQRQAEQEAYKASTAHYPPIPEWGREFPDSSKPHDGWPIPEGVLVEPGAKFLDDFDGTWDVAPANNAVDVVVFHHDYRAQTNKGEVLYEQDFRRDEEGREPATWLANIIALHKRLEEGRLCKRIARFRGDTPSSYRLEYPPSGVFRFIPPRERHDTVLALHQRRALQYLSASRHIHSKNIILNVPPVQETLWLRADFSLVVAAFTGASCAELGIESGYWANSSGTLESPFRGETG